MLQAFAMLIDYAWLFFRFLKPRKPHLETVHSWIVEVLKSKELLDKMLCGAGGVSERGPIKSSLKKHRILWHQELEVVIINTRHMCTRVMVVCLSVCYQSTACLRPLCNKMDIPANFLPNSQDFQLRDIAKMHELQPYSLF